MSRETFGSRLKDLRRRRHLSQQQVADVVGVSVTLISAYENGNRSPSIGNLILLADLFCTSTDYLLCRTEFDPKKDDLYISLKDLSSTQARIIQDMVLEYSTR